MTLVVALDLETTGFNFKKNDRVIEIAGCIVDQQNGKMLSRFETLINPMRNIPESSTKIHGLTSAHLSMAPTFDEFGHWLAKTLSGKRVVAHNALFDVRFLNAEFERVGIDFQITEWDCTCKMSKNASLKTAAVEHEIDYDAASHHGAAYDAMLCAQIYLKILEAKPSDAGSRVNFEFNDESNFSLPSLVTREQLGISIETTKVTSGLAIGPSLHLDDPVESCYLWRLADYLSDLKISAQEKENLDSLAEALGISKSAQFKIHENYVRELEKAALRDGLITAHEESLLRSFADALDIELKIEISSGEQKLPEPGSIICVTGTASFNGLSWGKNEISVFLLEHGFEFTDVLSKAGGVSLLLQDSEGSQSSKVEKARKWGIPRMTIQAFIERIQSR